MTRQDFLNGFFILFDELATFGAPGFEPSTIELLASVVQEDLIILKYTPKSNKLFEGFEESEKRTQDLGELVKYQTFSTFGTGFFSNSVTVTLPNTLITSGPTDFTDVFWLPVYESVITDTLKCNSTDFVEARVEPIKSGPLDIILRDPFNKPYLKNDQAKVLRLRSEGRIHTLITDGTFNVTDYKLGYIKKPTPIVLTASLTSPVSQLSDSMNRELLNETVKYALKTAREGNQFVLESQPKIINNE